MERCTWGYNGNGQLGDGSTTTRVTPVVMSGISTAVEIAGGDNHTMLRMGDGTLRACGYRRTGHPGRWHHHHPINPRSDDRSHIGCLHLRFLPHQWLHRCRPGCSVYDRR
ncbi:MAG: hypothetical protein IPN22_03135 [Bacteroidetes bacterium]|nr:hypothetical protein [Bacteroidota bacterium]